MHRLTVTKNSLIVFSLNDFQWHDLFYICVCLCACVCVCVPITLFVNSCLIQLLAVKDQFTFVYSILIAFCKLTCTSDDPLRFHQPFLTRVWKISLDEPEWHNCTTDCLLYNTVNIVIVYIRHHDYKCKMAQINTAEQSVNIKAWTWLVIYPLW